MVIFTKVLPKAQNIMCLTAVRLSNFWRGDKNVLRLLQVFSYFCQS